MDNDEAEFAIDRKDLIAGLGKSLQVIESFDDEHPRMTASQVAARTGITRTAARRYLLSLCHFGYAASDGRSFWLAPRVLRLGQSYLGAARLPRLVQPFIQRISMQCGENVNLSVLDGHEVVYIARSNAPRLVSIGYHIGARAPAHVVTPGPVILSTFNDEAMDRWIAAHDFVGFTARTVIKPAQFRDSVLGARALDYWITAGQLELGLCGIAVALRDRRGDCKGAISMIVQRQAYTDEQMTDKLLPLLRAAVQELRALV